MRVNNTIDKHAVKVVKGNQPVGHLPRKFSQIVWYFLARSREYNLRDNLKFDLTHKFWKGQNDSFIHRASKIWNSLPIKIKTAPSLAAFKASLVKNSKCIDSISFGCSATGTFKNPDDFIYF